MSDPWALNRILTVLKNYLDSPIALAQRVRNLVDSRHHERRLLKKIFLVSHRSTLCIRIYTIDIYIQEVSDLGRGNISAVLPEFLIFKGMTVCIQIYKKDIILHTAYTYERM